MADDTTPAVTPTMTDIATADPAAAPPPASDAVKSGHGKTAIVDFAWGEVHWAPAREAKALMDDGRARRATERDFAIAGMDPRDPATIERPLVETDKGVRLARPPHRVKDIL